MEERYRATKVFGLLEQQGKWQGGGRGMVHSILETPGLCQWLRTLPLDSVCLNSVLALSLLYVFDLGLSFFVPQFSYL